MGLIRRDLTPPIVWPPPRDPESVHAALDYARRRDPVGHRLHVALALFHMATLPLSTALSAISFALLVGYAMLRLPNTWRCYPPLMRVELLWALFVFTAWYGMSCLWSADPVQGLDELKAARVILLPLALWPVLDRMVWLIVAALIGILAQNGSQLLQYLHVIGDPADFKGRYRGLLDGQTAMWCLAAMVWNLAAALNTRGRWRWGSIAGLLLASAGLLAAGNRGPWIAAAIVMPLALIVIAVRRPQTRRFAMVLLVLGLVGSAAVWPVASRVIVPRMEKALDEVRAAREEGVYWTSGGLRLGLWKWAADAWRTAPIRGIGAGGYHDAVLDNPEYQAAYANQQDLAPRSERMDRAHAHNTYLQILAVTGIIGGGAFLIVLVLLIRQIVFDPVDHPYADGTLFVLLGWMIAANFDCYTLNGHLYGLLMFLLAISIRHRPSLPTETSVHQSHPHLATESAA